MHTNCALAIRRYGARFALCMALVFCVMLPWTLRTPPTFAPVVPASGHSIVGRPVDMLEVIMLPDSGASLRREVPQVAPEFSAEDIATITLLMEHQLSRSYGFPSGRRVVGYVDKYEFMGASGMSASSIAQVNSELEEIRRELLQAQSGLGPDMEHWPSDAEMTRRWRSAVVKVRATARDRLAEVCPDLAKSIVDLVVPEDLQPWWTTVD